MTNEELVERQTLDRGQSDKAFGKLVSALRPLVEERLRSKYYDNWEAKVSKSDKYPTNLNDTLCLLWTLNNHWPLFVSAFPQREGQTAGKDLVWDLKEYRNISTHNNPKFATQDKDKAIDNMIKLLELVVPQKPAIEKAISGISEIVKENLLKKMQAIDSRILPTELKSDEIDAAESHEAPSSEVTANTDDEKYSTDQKTQTEDQLSALSSHITEKLAEGQKKLEAMVSGAGTPPTTSVAGQVKETPTIVKPTAMPPTVGDLRVDRVQSANGVWWLLEIYDGDTFIGSYERSKTESEAKEKEIEILWPNNPDKRNIAADELRKAYAKNGDQPIVVQWNDEDKEKRIKTKRGNAGVVLGTIPKCCWRTEVKK